MRAAADLEVRTPKHAVTPAPTLPARELLGDLLREQSRPREALEEYTRSLAAYPNRFHSVIYAARAARQAGDSAKASSLCRELEQVADAASRRDAVNEARGFVSGALRN